MTDELDLAGIIAKRTELVLKLTELTSEYARLQTIVMGLDVGFQKLEDHNVEDPSTEELGSDAKQHGETSAKMIEVENSIHEIEIEVRDLDIKLEKLNET